MKVQTHGKPSVSKDGKKAQFTVLVGAGSKRRSVTRHAKWQFGIGWVGLNPDERAVPLNELYEQELAEANSELSVVKTALANLQKNLEMANEATPETEIDAIANAGTMVMLKVMIQKSKLAITTAELAVDDAESKLAIVQRDVPLEVEFFGPGLTY